MSSGTRHVGAWAIAAGAVLAMARNADAADMPKPELKTPAVRR